MGLRVVPEGLEAVAATIEAVTAQLLAAQAQAGSVVSAIVPPAADPVSVEAAVGLAAHGAQQRAVEADGSQELGRSGLGVEQAAASYREGDALAVARYVAEIG
ncbi:PE family protein [Segniliparus rugosus]|uniref:PE domain-containing protein n=1 Tax=Segniliparus rugosus (strain ATCC BAA-974 / DSM 45345 / CCUG 50838 / CIP 108380 / JCM 13579 / CDC 945) TaxID=679197 RepID=U1M268_SEGRC|nr:PE family protein [Segniliparus rugosus]ERG69180.1 hypothetical protein HMPREF9336_04324 [Segniliparus rugosus ATCC BAA-974]